MKTEYQSNCCGANPRTGIDLINEVCPECHEHCEYDEIQEAVIVESNINKVAGFMNDLYGTNGILTNK